MAVRSRRKKDGDSIGKLDLSRVTLQRGRPAGHILQSFSRTTFGM